MKKFLVTLALLYCVLLTGCDKTATLRKAEEFATQMRIYNRSIVKATNDAKEAGKIDSGLHRNVIFAAEQFSRGLDAADAGIALAKKAVSKTDQQAGLDFVERLIDTEVFAGFVAVVEAVTSFPPDVKQQIEAILASVRLAFAAIRTLFADAGSVYIPRRYANV